MPLNNSGCYSPRELEVSQMIEIPKNFTPGPWMVEDSDLRGWAVIHADTWGSFANVVVRFDDETDDDPEGRANAALIALAPQMAAELLALRADVQRLTDALAAAEGEAGRLDAERYRFWEGLSEVVSRCKYLDGEELGDIAEAALSGKDVEEVMASRLAKRAAS